MPLATLVLAITSLLADSPDTVLVCPPAFLEAMQPWLDYRTAQGHRIAILPNLSTAQQIRAEIRRHAQGGTLRHIVLVGDHEPLATVDPLIQARCVPTHLAPARVNVRWHSTPELATDNWYADLDDDGIPDVTVGRIPADSPQDLSVMIGKTLAYELLPAPGHWRRRINCIAGVGGLGPLIDPVVELATKRYLTSGIPPEYELSMTYANWRSPYCPSPAQFRATTVRRFNEGCLFWIYIGHGYPYQLDRVHVPGSTYPILNTADMGQLDNRQGLPIAVFLACYTGAFDLPYDCLAEQMLRAPGGPVAVLAGSRVTMPYAMAVFGNGLLAAYFQQRRATLGEVILHAKRQMMDEDPQRVDRKLLDLLARAMNPNAQSLRAERLEHVQLFNLLGDPLLRLQHPQEVELDLAPRAVAGTQLEIRGSSQLAGRCRVELVAPRDQLRGEPPVRQRFDTSSAGQAAFDATYAQANDHRWSQRDVEVSGGAFLTALRIPPEARGDCHICVFLEDRAGHAFAVGSRDLYIAPPNVAARPATGSLQDDGAAAPRTER